LLCYSHENGYGNIDTNSPEYQFGRELYDTQVMIQQLQIARRSSLGLCDADKEEIQKLLESHCRLIHLMGELRSDYSTLLRVIDGKDCIFRHPDGSETRRIKLFGE
jgi:hypothetical protein